MDQSDTDDQPTCGKGLAANAVLPAKLAQLTAAQAEVLERHMRALDRTEPLGQRELEAYAGLAREYRAVSSQLASLAQQMEGYHALPMASHDMQVMSDPRGQMDAFQQFVTVERELLDLLRSKLESIET